MCLAFLDFLYFNPRSPHGERLRAPPSCYTDRQFQSTLPAWGATPAETSIDRGNKDFNPRSPHGERPWTPSVQTTNKIDFNPRSPHGERPSAFKAEDWADGFQSTLPAWGATSHRQPAILYYDISIHAPRMGSDDFADKMLRQFSQFQSTLPAWGATYFHGVLRWFYAISIHAPRMGSDLTMAKFARANEISIHAPRMGSDRCRSAPCHFR